MPGWSNSDNKFGPGPFIVGTVLGDGCNYTSVQTAINDCLAAGGGTVFIRTGTYVENLTLQPTVDLYGFDVDGRLTSTLSHVVIQGNHTFTVGAGFAAVIMQNITFSCAAGDVFTITSTGGAQAILAAKFCGLEAFTDPASRCVVFNPDGTSACQFSTDNCNLASFSHTFEMIGAGSGAATLSLGSSNSSSGNAFQLTSGSGSFFGQWTQVNASNFIANFATPNGNLSFLHSDLSSNAETVFYTAGGGQVDLRHCNITCNAGSGNFLDGVSGQFTIESIVLSGSGIGTGGTLTETRLDWKPYAQMGAAPGLPLTVYRGTCAFDSAQFTVTDGFVQLAVSPGVLPWVDQPVSTTVVSNQGNFITGAGVTLTLPAAPVQGDTVAFKDPTGNAPYVIQANAGQILQVANQTSIVGGSATSSQIGDALDFVFYAAGNRWVANTVVGNFLIA